MLNPTEETFESAARANQKRLALTRGRTVNSGRTGSSPIVDGAITTPAYGFIISRSQDLIVLYPGAVSLVDHPSEGPTADPSTLPKHGRTPACPEAGPYACTAGSKPTLFPFPLPQDTPASWHWSNDSDIAPCSQMNQPETCHSEQRRSTMPRRGPRAPILLAPDSAPRDARHP